MSANPCLVTRGCNSRVTLPVRGGGQNNPAALVSLPHSTATILRHQGQRSPQIVPLGATCATHTTFPVLPVGEPIRMGPAKLPDKALTALPAPITQRPSSNASVPHRSGQRGSALQESDQSVPLQLTSPRPPSKVSKQEPLAETAT